MRCIIVEDDPLIGSMIVRRLKEEGFSVSWANNASEAMDYIEEGPFDVALLDVLLPGENGFSICEKVRNRHSAPIIFMSCLDDSDSIIRALEMGGDDYLVKPFNLDVLIARIKANLRRAEHYDKKIDNITSLDLGNLVIDAATKEVFLSGELIDLTALEYQILLYLVMHSKQYFSSADIYHQIWGQDDFGDTRTVPVHIRNIRRKIEHEPESPRYLKHKRGYGYAFFPDEDKEF